MAVEHTYEQDLESSRIYVAMLRRSPLSHLEDMRKVGETFIPSMTVRALNAALEEEITRRKAEEGSANEQPEQA